MARDLTHGYNAIAKDFITARSNAGIDVIRDWANDLPEGASVIDIGAGHGLPVTQTLVQAGLCVSAIEPSTNLAAVLRQNLPSVLINQATFQTSSFLNRPYDAAISIGLISLLNETDQAALIQRAVSALNSSGKFLFSAPLEAGEWPDLLTGQISRSLGKARYEALLTAARFNQIQTFTGKGGSNYYSAALST
ncbi:MAG: methyltransferase domain-containing protein [Pseudomonadota bacterium]